MTFIILIVTVLISWYAFGKNDIIDKYLYRPYDIEKKNEYWRFVTSAFLHNDWMHLIFNMISLFFFAPLVESAIGSFGLLFLYITGAAGSLLPNYFKNKRYSGYQALGASGAVSAVVFAAIMIAPYSQLMFILLPVPMSAWVFGLLYLSVSWYMYKRDTDNVGHDVHIYGSLYGLLFIILYDFSYLTNFINNLIH